MSRQPTVEEIRAAIRAVYAKGGDEAEVDRLTRELIRARRRERRKAKRLASGGTWPE